MPNPSRRQFLMATAAALGWLAKTATAAAQVPLGEARRWMDAAFEMKRRAETAGDQPYGAVVVLNDQLIGEGPSRVILRSDWNAHAEREAIADAQRRLGRKDLSGAILYSSSRPCSRCEAAAAEANIIRMIHGSELNDAGRPQN